jgi:muconate cycloisomerase
VKITRIEALQVGIPLRRPHLMAARTGDRGLGFYPIIKVHTDEGIVGLGEAPALKEWGGDHGTYFGESGKMVMMVVHDYLAPVLEGQDPFRIEFIHTLMDRAIKGHPYSKAALDMALYDIVGKALNTPVYQLLGGLFRREIRLAHSIGIMSPEKAAAEATEALEDGIRTIKLKVGIDPERDVAAVREVRKAVGPNIEITVDGNQGYATANAALRVLRRMEEYDVLFAEQPVEGLDHMAQLAQSLDMAIMADESAWTPQDILRIIDKKAADFISLYPTKPGGLNKAKKVAAVAEAAGLPCNVNGSAELGIANACNLHLSASTKVVSLACVYPVTTLEGRAVSKMAGRFYLDDIITEPFEFKDGCLLVPDGPGLGVELDESKVEKYRVA